MITARAGRSILVGSFLAALGCSDPVPLPAQGNLSLDIHSPSSGASLGTCPFTAKKYFIGNPNAPTTSTAGDRIVDGQNNTSVSCSVRGNGPYTFSGSIQGFSTDMDHSKVTVSFANGQIAADKSTGTATLGVFTTDLSSGFNSADGACQLKVLQVKPGSIWTSFSCDSVTTPPSQVCTVASDSVVVFENCDGK